jgi:hypothetical protein
MSNVPSTPSTTLQSRAQSTPIPGVDNRTVNACLTVHREYEAGQLTKEDACERIHDIIYRDDTEIDSIWKQHQAFATYIEMLSGVERAHEEAETRG